MRTIMKRWMSEHGSDGTVNPLFEIYAGKFMSKLDEKSVEDRGAL